MIGDGFKVSGAVLEVHRLYFYLLILFLIGALVNFGLVGGVDVWSVSVK